MEDKSEEEFISQREFAARKGVSPGAISAAVAEGRIKTKVIANRRVIYASELEAYEPRSYRERPGAPSKGRTKGSKNKPKESPSAD